MSFVDNKDFVFGNVPQTIIDDQEDILRSIHENSEAVRGFGFAKDTRSCAMIIV